MDDKVRIADLERQVAQAQRALRELRHLVSVMDGFAARRYTVRRLRARLADRHRAAA